MRASEVVTYGALWILAGCAEPNADVLDCRDSVIALYQNGAASPFDLEVAAERIVASGGAEFEADRRFLLALGAFDRCERAARQAEGPEAEPGAYGLAIGHAERARDEWNESIALRGGEWAAATRNVERVEHALETLRARQASADQNRAPRQISTSTDADPRVFVPRALLDRILDRLDQRELARHARDAGDTSGVQETTGRDW